MLLFSYDAKIYKAIESFDDINMIQNDLDRPLQWSKIWQLPLNLDKCKVSILEEIINYMIIILEIKY